MRMTGRGAIAALAGCAVAGGVLGVPGPARAASAVPVPGSAVPALSGMTRVGAVPASEQLTIQVWLKPDLAAATAFANSVSTPGNAEFHHYLSPDAYTARFGPSAAHTAAVEAWLTAEGLTRVHVSSGRDYVSATGPASRVELAFGVRISRYRAESTVIQSSDRDVSVPAGLAPDVLAVTGLDNVPPVTSLTGSSRAPSCSHYWAQHVTSFRPAYRGLTKGLLPVCGYSASQIRAAYGVTMAATGKGQTVALTENGAPPTAMFQTLTDFARTNHLPAPRPAQFRELVTGGGGSCGSSSAGAAQPDITDEAEMDSEAVYAMAPGASQLMVLGQGCNQDQMSLDADLAVLTGNGARPSASIVSNSWQIPIGAVSPQTVHAIDLRAAAEGVGMYFASGDFPGLSVTSSDPYSVAVGGTTLGIGAKNNRVFETGWSDDSAILVNGAWSDLGVAGAGGGTSLVWGQPAYQKGVVPASMSRVRVGKRVANDRAVPDIAADADTDSGMLTGYIPVGSNGRPGAYRTVVGGGTSLACPLIAGLVADAQQGQKSAFGFIDPLLYRLAGTRAFHDILPVTTSTPQQDRDAYLPGSGPLNPTDIDVFDFQERGYTQQVTAKGYDTMTGLGTPNGAAFLAGLRREAH
jgi:subtilase family serine protease